MSAQTGEEYTEIAEEDDEGVVRAVGDWFEINTGTVNGRGRLYFTRTIDSLNANSKVVASICEMTPTGGGPQRSGAHLMINEVVPENGRVAVKVWIDNVGVNINFRLTLMGRV